MFVVHGFEECQHVRVIGDVVPAYEEADNASPSTPGSTAKV